jgi:hypothetical protein
MLRSLKDLQGYAVHATDGDIGTVHAFYFDDQAWTIRYVVVDTGTWLTGRRVLISPLAFGEADWETQRLYVGLTREQVKNSPSIDLDKPVSRQKEEKLHAYYGWPTYWTGTAALTTAYTAAAVAQQQERSEGTQDQHLRSSREVVGYHIHAINGEIGHVENFIVDDETWIIQYMVVDTRNWLPGRRVLVAPTWVKKIDWAEQEVEVDLHQETIKNSPEYDPSAPVNREYEAQLYDYYGRPKYWTQQ